jgi:zinc protease
MREGSFLRQLPTREHRLTNGLTVVAREDRSAPVVAIVTHVKAGYFDEPEPVVGISHVLEHMYFKGTERRGAGDIARETKGAGGYLNAGTIYDYTSYYTVLPSFALEQGLDIQSDALMNSAIDDDELRRELLVITQEAKRKLDSPSAVAQESLFETMFDVHRIRRWRIGTEEVLVRFTREDVWRYYRNLYRPSNVVLAVAGDVDAGRVFELAERYYGGMPAGESVRDPGPEEPPRRGFRLREMTGEITRAQLAWGWRSPGSLDPDTPALDLLAVVLGQGRASRLYRDVREAGLVTEISAYNYTPRSVGIFGISAELDAAQADAALRAVAQVVEQVRGGAITAQELARAKNIMEARIVRRLETAEGQANLLAEWQALGDWRLLDDYADRLFAATADELTATAERYLEPDLGTLLIYRPTASPALERDADQLRRDLFDMGAPSLSRMRSARVEDGVHFYEADGLSIVIKPRHSSPLVSLAICVRGGAVHETTAHAGITSLMARTSIKGTRNRSGAQLAEETEALGGVLLPSVSSDLVEWRLSLPSRHFTRGVELLADAALAPVFPHADVERERRNALSDLERLQDDMVQYPMRLFLSGAFAKHPYGFAPKEIERALRRLTPDDLRAWHERQVLSASPWVFVVGDVEPDDAAAAVAQRFAGLTPRPCANGARAPQWPEHGLVVEVEREKTQTALVLGFPGPARMDPQLYALRLLANVVSGLGGRLFEELRSRHSLAYSVTAYPIARALGGAFIGYIATSPEREAEARARLLEELEKITVQEVAQPEVERAQRYTIGAWQIRSQTNGAQLTDLANALLLGEGLERIRLFESRINSLTPTDILRAAKQYFQRDRLVEGIVRGNATAVTQRS